MNYGYPGSSTHLENHNVSEEGFWPSFTDIMMVIVMVFLLVTVAVILNNWSLISNLKTSIKAQQLAATLADNRQEQNQSLEAKLSSLEAKLVTLNQQYQEEKNSLNETQQKLVASEQNLAAKGKVQEQLALINTKFQTEQATLKDTKEKLTETERLMTEKVLNLDKALLSLSNKYQTEKASLAETQQKLAESNQLKTQKDSTLSSLQISLKETLQQKSELSLLSKFQKTKIDEGSKAQQSLQLELKLSKSSLATLQKNHEIKQQEIVQLKEAAEEKTVIVKTLQDERGKLDKELTLLQSGYESTKKDVKSEIKISKALQLKLDQLQKSQLTLQKTDEGRRTELNELTEQLTKRKQQLATLEAIIKQSKQRLEEKDENIVSLRKIQVSGESQLLSLQGEFDNLDSKYQKLLRPQRSSKGKFVVSVIYKKQGGRRVVRLKTSPQGSYKTVSNNELETALEALKQKHKTDLYLKIIIPENSGLSYSEAWKFTNELQKKFDYYFQ